MLDISDFPWAECSITENRVMYISDSLSLRRAKRNTGLMRYEFELATIDMDMKEGRSVMAKLSAAVDDTLSFIHPRLSYTGGTNPPSGVAVIGGSASKGDKQINAAGFGEEWQLLAGDYIQFSNHSKVYQLAEDTPKGLGTFVLELTSELVTDVPDTTPLIVDGVIWYLSSDGVIETSMEANDNQDMQITITAVEKL